MITRRDFIAYTSALATFSMASRSRHAFAIEPPEAIKKSKFQFYNFLKEVASAQGMADSQLLVLNSTILPFDISVDTPYFNEELFRLYADRTFRSGYDSLQASTNAFQATRFSSQYRVLLNIASAQVDQNHPEIQNSLTELTQQLSRETTAKTNKDKEIEEKWSEVAAARKLDPGSKDPRVANDYYLQRLTWFAQVRYADQVQVYSDNIDRLTAQLDAVRRKVYTPSEMALLDNLSLLGRAYNIARPWNASAERSAKAQGDPLTDANLADTTRLPPALYDSSPLILPVGDLTAFLSASGKRGFSTLAYSSDVTTEVKDWTAGGRGSVFGYSLGGGGSGSSSFSRSMTKLDSFEVSFANISEYLADRSGWFNPGVLQDKEIFKLVKSRPELNNLQFIAVSLILTRGLTMKLKFSEKVNTNDWTQQSFQASGGASFFGFSLGGGGGGNTTTTRITVSENGLEVTFEDAPNVCRVLGARVEPFLKATANPQGLQDLVRGNNVLRNNLNEFIKGKKTYLDFQADKIKAMATPK